MVRTEVVEEKVTCEERVREAVSRACSRLSDKEIEVGNSPFLICQDDSPLMLVTEIKSVDVAIELARQAQHYKNSADNTRDPYYKSKYNRSATSAGIVLSDYISGLRMSGRAEVVLQQADKRRFQGECPELGKAFGCGLTVFTTQEILGEELNA